MGTVDCREGRENRKTKMSSFVQEYENKKETGNWNRNSLVQSKKNDQASRQVKKFQQNESFKTYKDPTTPSVKYTNRLYRSWEARVVCNQNLEGYKS